MQNSYSYAANNPIIGKDPDGRLVELISRPIGGPLGALGAHAFVFVTPDNPKTIGSISGVDTSRSFSLSGLPANGQLRTVANDATDYMYGSCGSLCPSAARVAISPPKGMTSEQFDASVVSSYNNTPSDLGSYFGLGWPRTIGKPNSNNTASTILMGAGVSGSQLYQYRQALQNTNNLWTPGLGVSATSPTYAQQVLGQLTSLLNTASAILSSMSAAKSTNSK